MAAIDRIEGLRCISRGRPVTVTQAALIIGCSRSWLLKQIRLGRVAVAGAIGKKLLFAPETVVLIARTAGVHIEHNAHGVQIAP